MKRILCLLLTCLLLSGCSGVLRDLLPTQTTAPAPETTSAPTQTTAPETTPTTAPVLPAITVSFERLTADTQEYARITAVGEQGETVWIVETDRYDQAQIDRVSGIGQWQQLYFFVDDGNVVALDLLTGSELWRNPDFIGSPAGQDACYITPDGTVYLCGFFGPDLYAVNAQGFTVSRIAELDPDYYWAHKLIPGEGKLTVCFSGGPEGDMGPEAYKVDVPIE